MYDKKGVCEMSYNQNKAVFYLTKISDDKLSNAISYLRFLYEQDYPLDDFDYELAKCADNDTDTEIITFDEMLQEAGLTYDDL